MTALALILGIALGLALGVIVMGILASGAREDACHECPDRRLARRIDEWRDGTDD